MVTIQRDGVQHFDPAKIITGAGVRVSALSLDDALTQSFSVIAVTPQPADAVDKNMTESVFTTFMSTDGSAAVKTTTALEVISKLVTERLWPATSADGAPMVEYATSTASPSSLPPRRHQASPTPQY